MGRPPFFFFFIAACWRLLPSIRAWSPSRRAAGGRGLRSPLPPTTPKPALGQPSLMIFRNKSAVPLSPFCRAAAGIRTPAVPRWRGTSVRPASEVGAFRFFFFVASWRLQPGIRAWSPARRAAGGRGLRSPLPPTSPNPALGQPSLTVLRNKSAVPLPPFCRAAAGIRTPAVPLYAGRASVRRRSFRPFRGGDLLRALPRLHQQGRIVVPALQAVRRPLLWSEENGFPLLSRCTVPENRCPAGKDSSPWWRTSLFYR